MRQPASVFSGSSSLRIGKAAYEIALKSGDIELVPFEVMRGRSWKNAFVPLDEA
jgi:phosphate starvation-inducible protein PhoH and related proteins